MFLHSLPSECSAPAAMGERNSNLFPVIGGIFSGLRSKRKTDCQANPNASQLISVLLSCVPATVLNIKLLPSLIKSIRTQMSKMFNANKNPQTPNTDFLCFIKDLHRKEIGSSGGGTFPTEPELKQNLRNSTCPGTGMFPRRNGTKGVFIYGIKIIFF